jgi:hypothetical protein
MENCDFMTGLGQFGDDVPPDKTCCANRDYPHWQISRNAQYFRFFILSYFSIALVKRALPELVPRRSRKSFQDCGLVTGHSETGHAVSRLPTIRQHWHRHLCS